MGLELGATHRKSESVERQTNTLSVWVFSWDLLTVKT